MFRFMGRGGTGGAGGIGGGAGTRLIGSSVDGFLSGVLGLGMRVGASIILNMDLHARKSFFVSLT
jgi:hypothetical protein